MPASHPHPANSTRGDPNHCINPCQTAPLFPPPAVINGAGGLAGPAAWGYTAVLRPLLRVILKSSGPPIIRSRWPASGNFQICPDVSGAHTHTRRHRHTHTHTRRGKKWIRRNPFKGLRSWDFSSLPLFHRCSPHGGEIHFKAGGGEEEGGYFQQTKPFGGAPRPMGVERSQPTSPPFVGIYMGSER